MKKIKIVVALVIVFLIVLLIKGNVTAAKENKTDDSSLNLEVSSELVKSLHSKLFLLQDVSLQESEYRNLYFDMEEDIKSEFSIDERLFMVLEALHKSNESKNYVGEDGIEIIILEDEQVKGKMYELFNEEVDLSNIDEFNTSQDCGLISYSHKDEEFEFGYIACTNTEKRKSKVVGAVKRENFIDLTVEAFSARTSRVEFEREDEVFAIRNYNSSKTIIGYTSLDTLENDYDTIFEKHDISRYIFTFELRGDDYYLTIIKEVSLI